MTEETRDHFYIDIPSTVEGGEKVSIDNFLIGPGWVRIAQYKPTFNKEDSVYISPGQLDKILNLLIRYKSACERRDDMKSYWDFIDSNGEEDKR